MNSKQVTLARMWRVFWCHPSPWMILGFLFAAVVARVVVGDWRWFDGLVPVAMVAVFPLFEWVVHVCVLHWRPRRVSGLTIDSRLAREHRAHHADPRNVPMIFIPWQSLLWILPGFAAVGLFVFPRLGMGLTFLVFLAVIGLGYEWIHYLIHTDYKPRGALFRAVWRHHRLHHFKNEHYWFTVTTSGTADRLLGTNPDPADVPSSSTVKSLHAQGFG
nr:sterol desaturase family protein [Kibdelosporangium sp. MJ126-NF4]